MAKLIMNLDGQQLKEIELDKERMTIGRHPSNDIPIDNLAISGEHAVIITVMNDSLVEDLGSTNGTMVNNTPIKKHELHHGDEIEIGKYHFKYVNLHAFESKKEHVEEAEDFEKTMILRRPAAPSSSESAPPSGDLTAHTVPVTTPETVLHSKKAPEPPPVTATAATETPARIQILNGQNAGKELELTKALTSLGKPGVQVAVITRRPQGYFITHVQGDHYPMVNGLTLDTRPHPLADHDIIELGGIKMEFYFK